MDASTDWLEERFDGVLAVLFLWFLAGVFADGHTHVHGTPISFFTPEHAIFYSAFLVTLGVFGLFAYRGWQEGGIVSGLPERHRLTFYGLLLFLAGGLGDLGWHTLFGIESTTEALYSPSHLTLAVGAVLFTSGPLRRVWQEGDMEQTWRAQFAPLTSAAAVLSLFAFMTMYAHPLVRSFAASWFEAGSGSVSLSAAAGIDIGMLSIILQSAILAGVVLLLVDRFELVDGALTYVIGLNALGLVYISGHYILLPAFLLGGGAADLLNRQWRPTTDRERPFRAYAVLVPAILFALYFLTVALTGAIVWTVHLWTGAIVLAGIAGLLVSYLIQPGAGDG